MAKLRRPHVVPAGYQRNFALGRRILVIDKATRTGKPIGVRDNFVARHFLRVILDGLPNDLAEDEFARIENFVLPAIRELSVGEPLSENQDVALKATMAMLWSRSFSREIVANRVLAQVVGDYRRTMPDDEEMIRRFRAEAGQDPQPGEIEAIVERSAASMQYDRLQDVGAMLRHYNAAIAKFRPLHVSLYRPAPGCEFITSDNPVVLARTNQLLHVGAQNGLALRDAAFIFLPVTRFVGACLTKSDEGHDVLDRFTTLRLNQASWRNAVNRIACHPTLDNWGAMCNLPPRRLPSSDT